MVPNLQVDNFMANDLITIIYTSEITNFLHIFFVTNYTAEKNYSSLILLGGNFTKCGTYKECCYLLVKVVIKAKNSSHRN